MNDKEYMIRVLELAKKGIGKVNPNPLVGAVIVKNGKIIGEGYHEKYGELHAERNALQNCTSSPDGATMYVTLEPCCHFGKTPPCTEAIINSKIAKVVVGTLDPNEKVSGKGIEMLQHAGIEVTVGVLEQECKDINEVFFHYITKKTPFVVMKYAMTMDGKIATVTGNSKWITGEAARHHVHLDRNKYAAIMVGIGTVIADNPMLNCRVEHGRNPTRIICDSNLRTPLDSNIVKTAKNMKTIIATQNADICAHKPYLDMDCQVLVISNENRFINLSELMQRLYQLDIDSVLLEGGSTLNFSALKSRIVSKVQCYIAPRILGGELAKSPIGGTGYIEIENGINLKNSKVSKIGEDFFIESEVFYTCSQE